MRQSRPIVENRAATNCFKYRSHRCLEFITTATAAVPDLDIPGFSADINFRFRFINFRLNQVRPLLSASVVGDRKIPTCGPSTTTKCFSDSDSVATSATGSANPSSRIRFSRPYFRRRWRRPRSFDFWSPSLVSVSGGFSTAFTSGNRPLPLAGNSVSGFS